MEESKARRGGVNLHNDEAHKPGNDFLSCAECNFQGMLMVGQAFAEIQREKNLLEDFERYLPSVMKILNKAGWYFVEKGAKRGGS